MPSTQTTVPTICSVHPRLAIALVLEARWDEFLLLMGICCSTFVSISRGSTHRSVFLPEGCPISMAVYKANKGVSRQELFHDLFSDFWDRKGKLGTAINTSKLLMLKNRTVHFYPDRSMLIVLLTIAAGGVPLIENPISTLLNQHHRFQHVVRLLKSKGISQLAALVRYRSRYILLELREISCCFRFEN